METISIQIKHPKAKQLLKDLADMNLIVITPKLSFNEMLAKLRKNDETVPTLDEISMEVEQVRKAKYEKNT